VPSGRLSQAGDISVRNSAMPKLTGTAIAKRDERWWPACRRYHQTAVSFLHRIPHAASEEAESNFEMAGPAPTSKRQKDDR
jgi:hypothetical protein